MAELVDAADSKSASSDRVPVQVRMGAPIYFMIDIVIKLTNNHICDAEIAQLVEQLTCNQ